ALEYPPVSFLHILYFWQVVAVVEPISPFDLFLTQLLPLLHQRLPGDFSLCVLISEHSLLISRSGFSAHEKHSKQKLPASENCLLNTASFQIGRAHVRTPVTIRYRMPSSS